ncbi:MAG: hypothetical protein AB7G93_19615 [Bdellovibrionales bacterium]
MEPWLYLKIQRPLSGCAILMALLGCQPFKVPVGQGIRAATSTERPNSDLKYLLFHTEGGSNPVAGTAGASVTIMTKTEILEEMNQLVSFVGDNVGDHKSTQLGVAVGPISFDFTDTQIRELISDLFSAAEETGVAVAFHIDDSMFWNRRQDLWSDRNNIEWTDWNGTTQPHRIIGWAGGGTPFLAPQMCYNSPAIITEATRLARDVIGLEIKKGIDRLNSIGKSHLFAGVLMGWETRLQDDSEDPHVEYGYCALTNLGYSQNNIPSDMNEVLTGVVSDWITLWTRSLSEAGIIKNKIFTHIAYNAAVSAEEASAQNAPPSVAFTEYSNPGFSLYGNSYPSNFKKVLTDHGSPRWGISEGTAVGLANIFTGGTTSTSPMESYLAGAFNNGAVYVNIFGLNTQNPEFDEFAKASSSVEAKEAYRKFLEGKQLVEGPMTTLAERLQTALKNLQDAVSRAQAEGQDISSVSGAMKELEDLLKANDTEAAIAKAKEILELIEAL